MEEKRELFELKFDNTSYIERLEFPHPLQMSVMPIIKKEDNKFVPIGTAFAITSNGLFLTAKHVIEDEIDEEIRRKNESGTSQEELEIYLLYTNGEKHGEKNEFFVGGLLPITRVSCSNITDAAILTVNVPMINGELIKIFANRLSPRMPTEKQATLALGYSKMTALTGEKNIDGKHFINIEYDQCLNAAKGHIEEVFGEKRDNVHINFPAFSINSRCDSGMSGGPIISEDGYVIGIISDSIHISDENGLDYLSYGVLLPPVFLLTAIMIKDESIGPEEFYLHQLAEQGVLNVDDSFIA